MPLCQKKVKTLCVDDLRHGVLWNARYLMNHIKKVRTVKRFENLADLIVSRITFYLRTETSKRTKRSYTAGTDKKNITDIGSRTPDDVVKRVTITWANHGYRLKPVRRKIS